MLRGAKKRQRLRGILLAGVALGVIANPATAWSIDDLEITGSGNIVVAGRDGGEFLEGGRPVVAKFDSSGSLVTRFGGDGIITPPVGAAATVQPDGKIVVVGGSHGDVVIHRFRNNGTLDRSFSRKGKAGVTRLKAGIAEAGGEDVVVRANGEILVAAIWYCHGAVRGCYYTQSYLHLLRLNARGRFIRYGSTEATDVVGLSLAPRRKVLAVAFADEGDSEIAARFISRGNPDKTFGHDGRTLLSGERAFGPSDVAAQADGSPVIAMWHGLARLTSRGHSDSTFGTSGVATCQSFGPAPPVGYPEALDAVEVQPDQRLVAVGRGCGLVRFTAEGQIDQTFGAGGRVNPGIANGYASSEVALQPDGRIVVAWWDSVQRGFKLARFLSDGSPDLSFGAAGTAFVPVSQH